MRLPLGQNSRFYFVELLFHVQRNESSENIHAPTSLLRSEHATSNEFSLNFTENENKIYNHHKLEKKMISWEARLIWSSKLHFSLKLVVIPSSKTIENRFTHKSQKNYGNSSQVLIENSSNIMSREIYALFFSSRSRKNSKVYFWPSINIFLPNPNTSPLVFTQNSVLMQVWCHREYAQVLKCARLKRFPLKTDNDAFITFRNIIDTRRSFHLSHLSSEE